LRIGSDVSWIGWDRHRFGQVLHGLDKIIIGLDRSSWIGIGSSLVWMVFSGEWIGGFHWNGSVVLIGLDGFGFFNGASFTGSSDKIFGCFYILVKEAE
jgi:hypothetical protein